MASEFFHFLSRLLSAFAIMMDEYTVGVRCYKRGSEETFGNVTGVKYDKRTQANHSSVENQDGGLVKHLCDSKA